MTKTPAAKDPTRNVWLQLGFPDAEEHYLKAELVLQLDKAIKSQGLTSAPPRGGSVPPNPSCRKYWEGSSPKSRSSGSCAS
jgi:hypothetical protein